MFIRLLLTLLLTGIIGHAEVTEPKPGTPVRKAIMDALREPVSQHVGKAVEFTGEVKMSGSWATFSGHVGTKDGKPPASENAQAELEIDFFALLKKEDGEWRVLSWGFSGDISAYMEARQKFPKVPTELMPPLN